MSSVFDLRENESRRVWGDKVTLATTAHAVGGAGVALLFCRRQRYLAFALLGLSALAHIYARMTASPMAAGLRGRIRLAA